MRHLTALSIAIVLSFWCTMSSAFAEKRVALVIGNASYTRVSPLRNPKNDAELMAKSLRATGFDVIVVTDVDVRGMGRAIRDFGKKLRAAGEDAVGLFYYAGHGIQSKGVNYLLPLNAEIETEADLQIESISSVNILSQMEEAGNALNLVILDACRNNPIKSKVRSASSGLARIEAASGSMVAFAAAPGQVASDGNGKNSPYTLALTKEMSIPGQSIERAFKNVRISVEGQTGRRQTPWEESSLKGDFYFTPAAVVKTAQPNIVISSTGAPEPTAPSATQPSQGFGSTNTFELEYWKSVKDSGSADAIQSYVDQYPSGQFTALANILIKRLRGNSKVASVSSGIDASAPTRTSPTGPAMAELNKCDLYAANPADPQRVGDGISFKDINTILALPSCLKAVSNFPKENRFAFLLGRVYDKNQAYSDAFELYRRAAENGYIQAMSNLGLMYKKGRGTSANFKEAAHWYAKAVNGGSATAMHNSAILLDRGLGVQRNSNKAASYIYQAIRSGYKYSATQLVSNDAFWTTEFWQEIQRMMRNDRIYDGRVDGIVDNKVRQAVVKISQQ